MNKRLLPMVLLTALMSAISAAAGAQGYPAHVVRILVGFSPGGSMDVTARLVAEQLKDVLGQQVLVENRTGAGGNIAAQALAKSPPDGYMLMLAGGGTMSIRQKFMKLPFDPARDFAPVIYVANLPLLLVVPASLPARSVRDLLTIARSRPGELTFSSSGVGSTTHLSAEMFQALSGVKLMHVPYKGSAQMIPELISGQVALAFDQITTTKPHLASGKLRALAISTAKRSALMPGMPTVAESGVPKYESASWNGFVVPTGVPKEIVNRLQRDIDTVLKRPVMVEKLAAMGAEPVGGTAEQFAAHIRNETRRWGELIDRMGIKPQ